MMDEVGGKRFAEDTVLRVLDQLEGANPAMLSTVTGLPVPMVMRLLYNLEDKSFIKVSINGKTWMINEEAFLS